MAYLKHARFPVSALLGHHQQSHTALDGSPSDEGLCLYDWAWTSRSAQMALRMVLTASTQSEGISPQSRDRQQL